MELEACAQAAHVVPAVDAHRLLAALHVADHAPTMSSIRSSLAMDDSLNAHDPFPLDPSLEQDAHLFAPQPSYPSSAFAIPPSPAMDLQYILSPNIILDDQQQQQQHHHQQQLVFPPQHQLISVPSSSRPEPPLAQVVRRPAEHVHPNPDDAIISFDSKVRLSSCSPPPRLADRSTDAFVPQACQARYSPNHRSIRRGLSPRYAWP